MTDKIEVFIQNSIRICTGLGKVYVDPFRIGEESHDAAYILITHDQDYERLCHDTGLINSS